MANPAASAQALMLAALNLWLGFWFWPRIGVNDSEALMLMWMNRVAGVLIVVGNLAELLVVR